VTAALVERITAAVDYLRISIGPSAPGEWLPCEPLVTDPDALGALVATTKEGRGTDRDDVAMSLFVQGYAFRIATTAIGGWLLGEEVLDVSPANTAIAVGRHRPNAVRLGEARIATAADIHEALVDGHLALLVDTAHRACRVGEALLWGNVSASCASSFGAFDAWDRAPAFFAAARPEVRDAGHLLPGGWKRKSCCLWYQTESGFMCEDCSLR
jgi:ferric iron reductase protein FhuF